MGTFNVNIEVGDIGGREFARLTALVDTGAPTTVVPKAVLEGLGIVPSTSQTFEYASGEQTELEMAEARVRVQGRETTTWMIFGEDGAGALLGANTLERVSLGVDPYNRSLIPAQGLLK